MAAAPIALDALGPNGSYHARNRLTVADVAGAPVAELSMVPRLYVNRAIAALRGATTQPAEQRADTLALAGRIFLKETVEGLSPDRYERAVSRVSGVPVSVVRSAAAEIADAADRARFSACQARPGGAVDDWRDPLTRAGRGVWTRRGNVFAVHAAGNHPGPHALWLEALALGYRVAVRPSRREPFTPHRLVSALRAAGFGDDRVVLLPTDHPGADEIMSGADLGIVYGGDDVVGRYAGDPTVLPQGPGRSKILITADTDWRDHLDTIVDSVSHHAGVACLNATAVLVDGDPAPLARAVADRLAAMPSLPPEDDRAVLPVAPLATAQAVQRYLFDQARGTRPWLGGDGIVDELGDGSAVLRPAVHQLDDPHGRQLGVELPFPCVWIAPWTPADGVAPLKHTLILTAITDNDALFDDLVAEPTISNVYRGDHPTWWIEPGVPHDGFLGEFLMRSKTVIRD
jgi:acyl-CoA reductase-like NAD-dependent aldehyde dehydrogenase